MKIKEVKLEEYLGDDNYSEMSQKIDCKFSFIEKVGIDKFKELFSPVKCKDYLEDLLIASKKDIIMNAEVYGFCYDKQFSIDENPYVCVTATIDHIRNIERFTTIINSYEENEQSTFIRVKDYPTKLILNLNPMWIYSPMMLSVLTYMLRICHFYTPNKHGYSLEYVLKLVESYCNKDYSYATSWLGDYSLSFLVLSYKAIFKDNPLTGLDDNLLENEIFIDNDYVNKQGIGIYTLHDCIGISSFYRLLDKSQSINKNTLMQTWVDSYLKLFENKL